jgi:predicted transcriptional regulator YdeE
MQIAQRPGLTVLGVQVADVPFDQLRTAVPLAWQELFSRRDELPAPLDGRFVEVSCHGGEGRYTETLGVAVPGPVAVPRGMTAVHVAAGSFVHHRHHGELADIAGGFQRIYDWSAEQGLVLGELKVDTGYTDDGSVLPHDLYIDIAAGS